jgi:uracil-DNA glycosylase
MLWGNNAREKAKYLTNSQHLLLSSVHPSPLSANRGFFGCKHFSQANQFLLETGQTAIDWQIPNIAEEIGQKEA